MLDSLLESLGYSLWKIEEVSNGEGRYYRKRLLNRTDREVWSVVGVLPGYIDIEIYAVESNIHPLYNKRTLLLLKLPVKEIPKEELRAMLQMAESMIARYCRFD